MDFLGLLREERAKAKAKAKGGGDDATNEDATSTTVPARPQEDLERAYEGPSLPSLQLQTSLSVEPSLLYLEDAVSEAVAIKLESALGGTGQYSQFTQLSSRLVAVFGKHPEQQQQTDPPPLLPSWLSSLADDLVQAGIFEPDCAPNNVLVNSYGRSGGIDHHTDGPAYHPVVAILSLGGPMSLSFRTRLRSEEVGMKDSQEVTSALLMPRSLLVFRRELYHDHLHGIATDRESEVVGANSANREILGLEEGAIVPRGPRISLTFRYVP